MKALAAEMVRNFGRRLEPLGIAVKELTGDMQLSKAEILKTQVSLEMNQNGYPMETSIFRNDSCGYYSGSLCAFK